MHTKRGRTLSTFWYLYLTPVLRSGLPHLDQMPKATAPVDAWTERNSVWAYWDITALLTTNIQNTFSMHIEFRVLSIELIKSIHGATFVVVKCSLRFKWERIIINIYLFRGYMVSGLPPEATRRIVWPCILLPSVG